MSVRILLIEDNPDHIYVTKKILNQAKEDFQIDLANDAKEGLEKILEQDYGLILCDYRLPGSSALEILRIIKEKGKDTPFVVVTASGNEKAAVDLMKEGAYDYILKDFSYEEMLPMVIKKSIEKYRLNKSKEKVENELRESEAKYSALIEQAKDAVLIAQNEVIKFANKAASDISGYSLEEIVGMHFLELMTPESKEAVAERYRMLAAGGTIPSHLEFRMRCKDRKIKEVELSASIIRYRGDVGYMGIVRDITERKETERKLERAYRELKEAQEQLIQSSKMAAMGQLAAGISHELNQPLTGIKGFAQAIYMDLEGDNPLRKDVSKIIEQADRIDNIIKNIRFFARKADFQMKEIDINEPLEAALMLLNEQMRVHNIRVRKFLDPGLPRIQGDANQLQQAFLNMISNARDAIDSLDKPEGGEVTVRSALGEDKTSLEVTFQDSGCGIPQENLADLFNPFFTTKGPDKGMGLGLAICYRIIDNHKGRIEVESEVEKGSTFRIILPVNVEVLHSL